MNILYLNEPSMGPWGIRMCGNKWFPDDFYWEYKSFEPGSKWSIGANTKLRVFKWWLTTNDLVLS